MSDHPRLGDTLFGFFFAINIFLVSVHGLLLIYLIVITYRYIRQFGASNVDPYTLSTLILLSLSTFLLVINLPWMIFGLIESEEIDKWIVQNRVLIVSIQECSSIFSRGFFTISIAVSATRWVR